MQSSANIISFARVNVPGHSCLDSACRTKLCFAAEMCGTVCFSPNYKLTMAGLRPTIQACRTLPCSIKICTGAVAPSCALDLHRRKPQQHQQSRHLHASTSRRRDAQTNRTNSGSAAASSKPVTGIRAQDSQMRNAAPAMDPMTGEMIMNDDIDVRNSVRCLYE